MNAAAPQPATTAHTRSRFLGLAAFAVILLLASVAVPYLSDASMYRSGLNVNIAPSDQLTGNVYIVAPEMRFDGNAPGNVSIATITGNVHGTIAGSLHLVAGRTSVRANVSGTVYVAAGNVTIYGDVRGDVVVAGGNVSLDSQGSVAGDVIVTGGRVRLDGTVSGSVYGSALSFQQAGTISGNLEIQTSRLVLERNARVSGDLRYQSPINADIAATARVTGTTERTNSTPWNGIGDGALRPFGSILKLTWSLLAGVVFIAAMPRLASRISDHASLVLQPAAVGIISLVLIPAVALLLMGTILGIPIGIMLLLMLPIGLYFSQIFAGLTIGRFLMPRSWRDGSRGYLLLTMTIGVIIIAAIRMAPVPFLGPIATAIVTFWGFGSMIMVLTDLTSRRLRENIA